MYIQITIYLMTAHQTATTTEQQDRLVAKNMHVKQWSNPTNIWQDLCSAAD